QPVPDAVPQSSTVPQSRLKQRGILNLPGFLLSSEKLVILWSEHYFSRLWCVFEMATYLKDPSGRERTQIIPVKTGALLWLSSAGWYVLCAAYNVIYRSAEARNLQPSIPELP
ncbi:unnamed protein product, partial [Symbiodinium microadriaticum]